MKERILHIILMFVLPLMVVSCATEFEDSTILSGDDDYITLSLNVPGVQTRGEVADNEYESYLSHIDVVVYEHLNGAYTPFHYQRIKVSDTPNGRVSIAKTKQDFKENVPYRFYVIANSTLSSSDYYDNSGNIISRDALLDLEQTDENIHLSGIEFGVAGSIYPQMFLMDGVAYMADKEPQAASNIIINSPDTGDDVTIKVTLRRAAAKVQISITPGEDVTLTKELLASSNGYMVRNMPIRTRLAAAGEYPTRKPYWKSSTISQTPYFEVIPMKDGEGNTTNYQLKITLYCYSHKWNKDDAFEEGTSVVLMLPMKYQGVEYRNNYYQISFSKKEEDDSNDSYHLIKRNTYYDLRINLNAPGAEDFNEPEEINNIKYFTAPWEQKDLDVSGESTVKYLKVNKEKIYMYNVADDTSTLYFSSSSPVTVKLVSRSAYYYNKYNQKITLNDNQVDIYAASTEAGATSGNISVHSDIPTNNTIRYFQLEVTNQEGMSEIVNVEQYPLIYITNNLPWYSYRDDYYYRTTGGHKWNGNVDQATAQGDLPTTYENYGDHIVSIYQIESVDVKTKTVKYTYSSAASSNNHGWTCSKVRGNKVNNSENYAIQYYSFSYKSSWWGGGSWSRNTSNCENHNVRNYHVRMMASSKDYTLARPELDEYGYTAGDKENSKLVSPSFVIASRLGAVLSTYSGLSNMTNDKKLIAFADHCKNYVEVDDVNDDKKAPVKVYDNWRLPTEAELKIIMEIQGESGQNADAIDFLLNGGYYMSASGPVYNHKNNDNTNELANPMNAEGVAIRCVRDAF